MSEHYPIDNPWSTREETRDNFEMLLEGLYVLQRDIRRSGDPEANVILDDLEFGCLAPMYRLRSRPPGTR